MNLVRSILWFSQGIWKYTKFGFERAQVSFDPNALNVTLENKIAIVTGSSSGLGYETAYQLALRGATVHIICRNKERGEDALVSLKEKSNSKKIFLHLVDMSNMKAIHIFFLHFKSNNDKLDILINNAGAMIHSYQLTEEGVESNFAVNTLGTYYFTELLLPLLQSSNDARVITVSSGGMLTQSLEALGMPAPPSTTSTTIAACPGREANSNTDTATAAETCTRTASASHVDKEAEGKGERERGGIGKAFDGTAIYAQNKRQQVELTDHWADRYGTVGTLRFYSMHPGWTDTPGLASSLPAFRNNMRQWLRTPEQGADTIVWAAVAEAAALPPSGSFLEGGGLLGEGS